MRFDWVGLGWTGLDCSSWSGWREEGEAREEGEGEGEKSCRVGGLSGVGGRWPGSGGRWRGRGSLGSGLGWDGMGWDGIR